VPTFRTEGYVIWRACERFGMLPPGVEPSWDDNTAATQARLITYSQTRDHEEAAMAYRVQM
jgi:hypothetical protein